MDLENGVIRAHKTDLYLTMTYYPPGAIISVFLEKTDQSKILPTGYTIVYQGIEKNKKYYSITRNSKPGSTINRIIALTYIPTQNDNSYTGGFELYDPLNVNQHWFIKD